MIDKDEAKNGINIIPMFKYVLRVTGLTVLSTDHLRFVSIEAAVVYSLRNHPGQNLVIEDHNGTKVFEGSYTVNVQSH